MNEIYCKDCGKMHEEGAEFYKHMDVNIKEDKDVN